jgi:hypothetical protein
LFAYLGFDVVFLLTSGGNNFVNWFNYSNNTGNQPNTPQGSQTPNGSLIGL